MKEIAMFFVCFGICLQKTVTILRFFIIFLYIFYSKLSIDTIKRFEKENYEEIVKNTGGNPPQYVYFNKGL